MRWESWRIASGDEERWREAWERGLLKAESLGGYVLRLWFEEVLDVAIYDLDFGPLLLEEDPGPALHPLKDLERFQMAKADYALIWLNPDTGAYDSTAIDLAPECVRFFCQQYGQLIKAAQPPALTA